MLSRFLYRQNLYNNKYIYRRTSFFIPNTIKYPVIENFQENYVLQSIKDQFKLIFLIAFEINLALSLFAFADGCLSNS